MQTRWLSVAGGGRRRRAVPALLWRRYGELAAYIPRDLLEPRFVHRRGRETGEREESELEAPGQLFDYVTEEEYAHLVRERQAEGFILDDGE